jgi:uroporphyrin-3 C-methyltransferase
MSDERPNDVAGDADDDDNVSMQAVEPDSSGPRKPVRSGISLFAAIAFVAALAALVCSGVLLWNYRQFNASLADVDARAQAVSERARAAEQAADDALERLAQAADANSRSMRALDERLESIPGQFADVQRRIDALQGGSFDARRQWLTAEATYYLGVANAELHLGGRWENALTALRLADERLRATGDAGLAPVREQIADEILALESVRLVDVEGLAHSLSRLGARAAELPLRAASPREDSPAEEGDETEPGLGRLWSSVKSAFSSIVRVERLDEPILAALTAEEQRLIRRQLSVELQTARLALVSAEAGVFRASLEQAAAMLRVDFNAEAPDVESGLRLVESLLELDVAPTLPDISQSLAILRARGEP